MAADNKANKNPIFIRYFEFFFGGGGFFSYFFKNRYRGKKDGKSSLNFISNHTMKY